MVFTWRRDASGNRVSHCIINNKKFTLTLFNDGKYTCYTTKPGSEAGHPILLFEEQLPNSKNILEAAEDKFSELLHLKPEAQKCKLPEISIKNGLVYISYDIRDTVKFTVNGSDVKKNNKIYKEPFPLEDVEVIKAKAFNKSKEDSEQVMLTIIRK